VENERPDAGALPEPSMRPAEAPAHRLFELRAVWRQAGAGRL